jgi:succinoglycan biosynthesis transport protein ExoP
MPNPPDIDQEQSLSQTVEKVRGILIRRRWLILGAICTTTLGTIAVSFHLPNRYTSEATIFAVQQRVPERYVISTSTSDVSQALEAMVQEVLSRPRLLEVIDEFGLYPNERKRLQREELIQLFRREVKIEPIERKLGGRAEVNAFKVSFVADDPQMAQTVTQRLTTLFIKQNLKTRADQAATTTEFLREHLELAKNKLNEQEQRLRDYKMQHLGELPEQQQGNLGILTGLQSQLENVMANRNQAQQQRLYLDSLLSEYRGRSRRVASGAVFVASNTVTPLEAAQRELTRLQSERRTLLTVYTPQYPDILKKDQEIEMQQRFIDNLMLTKAAASPERPAETIPEREEDVAVAQLRSQLQANTLEIENLGKKEQKLRTEIDQYQSRLNVTPVREQQLASMQRDYDLLRQSYGDLLKKEQESQLATNLEKRQEGQQFQLSDPPNLPSLPSSPQRVKMSLIALAAGLILGCALALLVEMRKSPFYSENDVTSRLALPFVVGIPLFFTPAEERSRSWRKALEWVAGSALMVAVFVAEFYVYRHG